MSGYLTRHEVEDAAVSTSEAPENFGVSAAYWAGEGAGFSIARYNARKSRSYRPESPFAGTVDEPHWEFGFDAGMARFEADRKAGQR